MQIKELSIFEFDEYANRHSLKSYHQTLNYALLMAETGYTYDLIGFVDASGNILASSLILIKKLGWNMYYGYAPKGFLIDYMDQHLLRLFTEELKKYYAKKNVVFIKINPEIAIGEIEKKENYKTTYNPNSSIIQTLKNLGYTQENPAMYFEDMLPRFNAILPLKDFNLERVSKTTRNKIRKGMRKGLSIEKASFDKISYLYQFIKIKKVNRNENYYKEYYNIFNKNNGIDLFLLKVNFEEYLVQTQEIFNAEQQKNAIYNELIKSESSKKNLNKKMESDRLLAKYKNDIIEATNGMRNNRGDVYVAAALVVKFHNRINFVISGYDHAYKTYNPNHFLYYQICQYYKREYSFADLNGITGDFTPNNPYHGLNQFKIGFNPKLYEFIGEFDLIINEKQYYVLQKLGKIKVKKA